MAKKRSRNKSSTRANPSSAQQGTLSSAQRDPHTGVSAACAKPVALQADPSPLSAQTAASSMERTWVSFFKPIQQGPSSSAQRDPHSGVSAACAKPVALQADPGPFSAQEGSSSSAQTAAAYEASLSVANTTAAPAPAQRLYARCLLKEFSKNRHQWDEEQSKRGFQNILRSLAGKVAHLGSKGIAHGRLTGENILVIGNKAENLEVEILDTPKKYNRALPSYREQFRTLASKMVDAWEATCPLASKHFLKMLEHCIPWFYFKQLQWHPLLLSSNEVAMFIFHLYTHLDVEKKGWKKDYKRLIAREKVDFGEIISGTFRGAFSFAKVYSYPRVVYDPNAQGALMFFRHALVHVNDYIYKALEKENVKPEEIAADALLTQEEIVNTLVHFFPKVPLELFNYMLYKGIDINAVI
ncbi:hypothetical protein PRUPE_2G062400 [Prunus persica]|uniref:Uncharacterized protein n=1 Tax=Prunus persica TaxID=3760 RepID=A0A251QC15_PRUPE|nr:uncharacterized protein LOC109947511 [Prunus persica]ONI21381.1 hypothetical protein PRUPE_2G062400 [Prunus persica]ONI21382.1 hypothetical protein PRUPE_2G062400 [Prunus persica]